MFWVVVIILVIVVIAYNSSKKKRPGRAVSRAARPQARLGPAPGDGMADPPSLHPLRCWSSTPACGAPEGKLYQASQQGEPPSPPFVIHAKPGRHL